MPRIAAVPGLCLAAGMLLSPPPPAWSHDDGVHVTIREFAYWPARVEVRPGELVVWTNADPVPHTATAADGARDTEGLRRGASAGLRFRAPGIYAYICAYHPQMRGEVVVRE